MNAPLHSESRRKFLTSAGAAAFASALPIDAEGMPVANPTPWQVLRTGNGEWTYDAVSGWGGLPTSTTFGGTHGAIAQDNTGNIYVSTQSTTGILVYASDGRLLKTIAQRFPEVHSMVHAEEDGTEYFYATVQKGTPSENWLFVKMKTDGTPVLKITAPAEAGFKAPNEWRITAAVPAPDGSIFVANGYGDSRIFHFDRKGNYLRSYSGKGSEPGMLNCSHGLTLDTRYDQPLLMRVNDRIELIVCYDRVGIQGLSEDRADSLTPDHELVQVDLRQDDCSRCSKFLSNRRVRRRRIFGQAQRASTNFPVVRKGSLRAAASCIALEFKKITTFSFGPFWS